MGKQVKWTPPEEDEIVSDTTQPIIAEKNNTQWTPPKEDEIVSEPLKKKDQPDQSQETSSNDSQEPGTPSGKNTTGIQLTPEQRKTLGKNTENKTTEQLQKEQSSKNFQETKVKDAFGIADNKSKDVITSLTQTITSGLSDQLPKEYYTQRLRMSKGSFGDLYDSRSDLNAFGGDKFAENLPKGTSIDAFKEWNNKQPFKVKQQSYDERAKLFLTEKLGAKGFEELKSKFAISNVEQRIGFEKNIQEQNVEAGQKLGGVVQDLRDVNGAGDLLSFAGNMIGQALYRVPTSLVGGPTGSIIAESAAVYDRQLDLLAEKNGISREEVIKQGLDQPAEGQALGVLAGTLDAASELNIIGMFKKAAGKQLTENIIKQFAKGFVRGAAPEVATEVTQGELEEYAASKGAGVEYHPDGWRMATSAVGALIGGGVLGGSLHVKLSPALQSMSTEDVVKNSTTNQSADNIPSIEQAADIIDAKVQGTSEETVAQEKLNPPKEEIPASPVTITDQLPTTQNLEENAVQERNAKEVLQREQGEAGGQGGERGGMERGQQGESPTGESIQQEEAVSPDQKEIQGNQSQEQQSNVNQSTDENSQQQGETQAGLGRAIQGNEGQTQQGEGSNQSGSSGSINRKEEVRQEEVPESSKKRGVNGPASPIGPEQIKLRPRDIHKAANEAGVEYDTKAFMNKSEKLTGRRHLDDMTQKQLAKMLHYVNSKNKATTSIDTKTPNQIIPSQTPNNSNTAEQKQISSVSENNEPEKERKFANQILNDPNIDDDIKVGLSQNAKGYIPKSMSITDREAKAIIDVKGTESAMADYMDRSNEMSNRVRATLGQNLIRKFNNTKEYANAIKVADNLSQYFTDLGQAVNSAKIFQMLDPEAVLLYVSKEINKSKNEFSKKTSEERKKIKSSIDDINKKAVDKILTDPKIRNKIISESKTGSIKKAIDFLETLKINTSGKILDATYGLTAAAWNTLITAIQKGLQAGLTITQAINKAVGKVKTEKDFKEEEARKYLDEKLKDYRVTLDPEKAIKTELKANNDKIDNVIKLHYSVIERTKRSLVEKLVKDANIDIDQAESVAKELENEFDRLTKDAKQKALNKYLPKPINKKLNINKKSLVDEIIEASNIGALSDEQYRDKINTKIGIAEMTDEQAEKIFDLADKVQRSKDGFEKTNSTEKLMNYLADMKGIRWIDVGMSIWYANILSGISTQILNVSANFAETAGEVYTSAIMNPKETGWILKGLFNGWGRGILEAMDTTKHGHQPSKFETKINASSVLERTTFKGGKWNPYNYLKYVSRIMNAADIFFYHGLNEMRARELAVSLAKKENKPRPTKDIIKKATEIIYKGENPYKEALEKAKDEGFKDADLKRRAYEILEQDRPEFIIKDSNDEAARGTFNYDPEGTLGALTSGINQLIEKVNIAGVKPIKFIIPFTRIIANVTNRYLDWTPVGFLRAAKGGIGWSTLSDNHHRQFTDQERAEVLIRAITGVVAMGALYAMTDDDDGIFEITANGTGDIQKNYELQETGWRPYSLRIGNTWWEYKNTPLAIPFATIGFLRDAQKYQGKKDMEAKASIVMFGTMKYVMDLSFLQSLSSFMDTFSKDNRGGAENFFKKSVKTTEATVKSFIVPNAFTQVSRSLQEVMDMPIKKANAIGDQIIRDIPLLRDHLGNIYDALGDPVRPNQIERFIPLKPSSENSADNKLWKLISDNNAWIGKPGRSTQKLNGDTLTDEEYDKYSLLSARITKRDLITSYPYLRRINSPEVVKDEISHIKSNARREAREILFGF